MFSCPALPPSSPSLFLRGGGAPAAAAAASLALGGLPLGLAHGVKLLRPVKAHAAVRWDDVAVDAANDAVRFRREMEGVFPG